MDDYATVNLRTRFHPWEHVEVWARIDNLFDSDYETGGTRNFNAFADPIAEERFLAPGAPARRVGRREAQVLGRSESAQELSRRALILTIGPPV